MPGDFDPAVQAEAARAAAEVRLPPHDATDIAFITVDPPGSLDLDQALHIASTADGFLVSYAIADVASFVSPGSALDVECQRRGETLYFPDARVPLHPAVLSEDAASLRPGQVRPAILWQLSLDVQGEVTRIQVQRAQVRSTAQWDYSALQKALTDGSAPAAAALLPQVGELRLALGRKRGAINLDLPEQQVEIRDGTWSLVRREQLPVERYNAEISLMTGMAAAALMLRGGTGAPTGILRTVPPPSPKTVDALRRVALGLGVAWPAGAAPGPVLDALDRGNPRHFALLDQAASLLRGSGYATFDAAPPEQVLHAGVGAPYAHVTAPLRRLVDRYGSEICLAISSGQPIPQWVRDRLPDLPATMSRVDRLAHEADRAVVDMTEAWLLVDRVGEVFTAVVLDVSTHSATIALDDPPVRARCTLTSGAALNDSASPAPTAVPVVGARISVRLVSADVASRNVQFIPVTGTSYPQQSML